MYAHSAAVFGASHMFVRAKAVSRILPPLHRRCHDMAAAAMHASPLRIARPSLAPMSRALPAAAGRGSWLRGSASGASGPAKFVATVAGVAALRCQRLRRGGAASAVGQRRLVALAPPWRAARGAATASAAAPEAAPVRAPANDQRGYRLYPIGGQSSWMSIGRRPRRVVKRRAPGGRLV